MDISERVGIGWPGASSLMFLWLSPLVRAPRRRMSPCRAVPRPRRCPSVQMSWKCCPAKYNHTYALFCPPGRIRDARCPIGYIFAHGLFPVFPKAQDLPVPSPRTPTPSLYFVLPKAHAEQAAPPSMPTASTALPPSPKDHERKNISLHMRAATGHSTQPKAPGRSDVPPSTSRPPAGYCRPRSREKEVTPLKEIVFFL